MSPALLRLDFGVLTDSICAFRGEEKVPRYHGPHPKGELIQKLTWMYDPTPYILGQCVTYPSLLDQFSFTQVIMQLEPLLTAISRSLVIDLVVADLAWSSWCTTSFIHVIKLCSVIMVLQDLIGACDHSELILITQE
jgi:hypothetical protein